MDKKYQGEKIFITILAGIILGFFLTFSPGGLFIIFLAFITILFIRRIPDSYERNFILKLFIFALLARFFFSLVTMYLATFTDKILNYTSLGSPNYSTPYIIDDSGYYTLRAIFTADYWMGKPLDWYTREAIVKNAYGFSGFIYALAAFFYLFGYSPISSRLINCLLGSVTVILIYYIVKNIFGPKPARLSAILTAFFPSMFLWSITNLKDTSFIFIVYLMIWSIIKFRISKKYYYIFIAIFSIWLQFVIRSAYNELLLFNIGVFIFYFCYLFIANSIKRKKFYFLIPLFFITILLLFFEIGKLNHILEFIKQKSFLIHKGVISEGGSCYYLLPRELFNRTGINNLDFFNMIVKGWIHVLFEPFPWKISSLPMLSSLPQMIFWYILIFYSFLGMGISLRYNFNDSLILVLYLFVMVSILAVTGGNIGTIFRLREVITPTLIIFSSVALMNIFGSLDLQLDSKKEK